MDVEGLRGIVEQIRQKDQDVHVVLGSVKEGKVAFVCSIAKSGIAQGLHAGQLIKQIAQVAGGSGGGRPDMAQAGAKDPSKLQEALNLAKAILEEGIAKTISK